MKIEKVEGLLIGSDLIGTNFVVRITTDTGITGIGQSGAWGFPDAAEAVVNQFREYLIGQDPFRIDHIQQSLYRMRPFRGNILSGALSAIDIALWDIKGKHYGAPIWDLLGGKFRDKVERQLDVLLDQHDRQAFGLQLRDGAADLVRRSAARGPPRARPSAARADCPSAHGRSRASAARRRRASRRAARGAPSAAGTA